MEVMEMVKEKDISVVKSAQLAMEKKGSPPALQVKKRQRPASVPEENSDDFEQLSDRKMMEEILGTVRENRRKLTTFEQSLSFVHEELEAVKKQNEHLKAENAALNQRFAVMDERMSRMEIDISEESRKRDNHEANSRLFNLEISGVPSLEGETWDDCKQIVGEVMKLVGSEYGEEEVDVAHRKAAGGIIALFKSRTVRNEVYSKRFSLVGKTAKNVARRFMRVEGRDNDLYINESLTFDGSKMMKICRDKLKPLNAGVTNKDDRTKTKTSSGNILIQDDSGNFKKIKTLDDFTHLYPNL